MALPIRGPYSGVSTAAFVARASALAVGVVYGSIKLSFLQSFTGMRRPKITNITSE